MPSDSPERAERTRKFQLVNDAYYTLSDSNRRREYDAQRRMFGFTSSGPSSSTGSSTYADPFDDEFEEFDEEIPSATGGTAASGGFPSWAWNFFTGQANSANTQQARQENEQAQFGDVFEEMLREEGMAEGDRATPTGKFWSIVGGLSGGAMGFIVANFPGMVAGAVAGNRLGAVRDAKGKSVYEVFQELPQADKARMLSDLAAKVFATAVGS